MKMVSVAQGEGTMLCVTHNQIKLNNAVKGKYELVSSIKVLQIL